LSISSYIFRAFRYELNKIAAAEHLPKLTFIGTGALKSKRTGAALLINTPTKRVQIDAQSPQDIKHPDELLITDPKAWNARAAKKEGGTVRKIQLADLTIEPKPVKHTSHPVFGYLIKSKTKTVAYAPEFWKIPKWAKGADVLIADGSSWSRPIIFKGKVGGHVAAKELVDQAKSMGIKRIILTHIGKNTEHALAKHLIKGMEVARDHMTIKT
jgi:hypothetical protein